jgi:hypothetical protein
MSVALKVSSDVDKLRKLIAVPAAVHSVRWTAAPVAQRDTSGLPGPSDMRLYALLHMHDPASRDALDLTLGQAISTGQYTVPAEVAAAILDTPAQPLHGLFREPGDLQTGGLFHIVHVLQLAGAVLVVAITT